MNYTRRSVLRNAGRVSLGLAASSSLPLLTACGHKWGPNNPSSFNPGIRIFFIGAWMFCKDPTDNSLLAVTLDMPNMHHTFPYGVWPGPEGINRNESLQANPTPDPCVQRNAYPVTLPGFKSPWSSVADFFAQGTLANFNYFENTKNDMCIDFTQCLIRVVSFPLPSRMITADITTGLTIVNADDDHPFRHPNSTRNNNQSSEAATAHIFEYDGANTLTFNEATMIDHESTSYPGDFHFHTVTPPSTISSHAIDMFRNLISAVPVLCPTDFTFSGRLCTPGAGPSIPNCVDASELALPPNAVERPAGDCESLRGGSLASCAAPGYGINSR